MHACKLSFISRVGLVSGLLILFRSNSSSTDIKNAVPTNNELNKKRLALQDQKTFPAAIQDFEIFLVWVRNVWHCYKMFNHVSFFFAKKGKEYPASAA